MYEFGALILLGVSPVISISTLSLSHASVDALEASIFFLSLEC